VTARGSAARCGGRCGQPFGLDAGIFAGLKDNGAVTEFDSQTLGEIRQRSCGNEQAIVGVEAAVAAAQARWLDREAARWTASPGVVSGSVGLTEFSTDPGLLHSAGVDFVDRQANVSHGGLFPC
jgi:hypothetical protein